MKVKLFSQIVLFIASIIPVIHAQDSLNVTRFSNELLGWDRVTWVSIQDNIAYLATEESGLYLLDITDPGNPFIINTMIFENGITQVDVVDSLAYVYVRNGTLKILNISDPNNILVVNELYEEFPGEEFIRIGSCLIAERGTSSSAGYSELTVVDVTDPYSINFLGSISFKGNVWGMAIKDSIVYASTHSYYQQVTEDKLLVIDFSDMDSPIIARTLTDIERAHEIEIYNNYLYHISSEGLCIYNISNTASPEQLLHLPSWKSGNIEIENNHMYSFGSEGFEVFGLSNPLDPSSLNEPISDIGGVWSFDISNGTVVAGRSEYGVVRFIMRHTVKSSFCI